MNTHIPQHVETAYELVELTAVPTQIIDPATSDPIIQVVNDTLVAAYLITHPDVKIPKKQAFNLLMTNSKFNGEMMPSKDGNYSGQDMFSFILPDISITAKNKSYEADPENPNNTVIIENGRFKQGILDITVIGKRMIHMIYDSFGSIAVKDFLDNNQRMLNRWLESYSFTMGIGDCVPSNEDNEKIEEIVLKKIAEVNTVIKESNVGIYQQNLDNKFIKISLESDILDKLRGAKMDYEKYIRKTIDKHNAMYTTMSSGAKGDLGNICQVSGLVGQQEINGERVAFGYDRRTLPHFSKDDYGAKSRGFVINNFFNGLEPIEMFFHQMGGRTGAIDTAIKSVSGDTAIIIIEDGKPKYVKIGEWIDAQLNENSEEIERLPEKDQELLKTRVLTFIPTTDDDGNVSWGEVTAVTRHDPGQEMYKIRTAGGREVKVVESKSLIVWDEVTKKFLETPTPEIKEGDFLPVTLNLATPPQNDGSILLASNEDIENYLRKYLSCENFNDSIKIENISEKEINEFSYLFSRIGIYTELGKDCIRTIINPDKKVNDVVCDPIVLIEKLPVSDYPKVYDITVPSTLNFGLANGLQVRDTAESGYMQRRLIKALEDLCVKYGGTIRNGMNNIVQFAYGDDGIDPCKLNKQELKLVEMSDEELEKRHLITEDDMGLLKTIMTPTTYKEMTAEKDYLKKFEEEYKELKQMRNYAREHYFKYLNVMNTTVFSPINFIRTIQNARDMFKIQLSKKTDLLPSYVRQTFKDLEEELLKFLPTYSLNIFRCLLYSNLSIKMVLIELKLNKTVFKFIMDTIRERFLGAMVQPGEMVGVIGAQSMGQPLTQMSVPSDTLVMINYGGKVSRMQIGEFVDAQIRSRKGKIQVDESGKHTVMDIMDNALVMSVTPNEKNGWMKISKVSRHPVNGQLMTVVTRTGRTTRATLSHSFLKRTETGIEPIEGSNLRVGDRIPVTAFIPEVSNKMYMVRIGDSEVSLDEDFGYFCGSYVGGGLISKFFVKMIPGVWETICGRYGWEVENCSTGLRIIRNGSLNEFMGMHFGIVDEEKKIGNFVYQSDKEFIRGFLTGYLDTNFQIDQKKMVMRSSSYSREMLVGVQFLFNYFGIFGIIGTENRRSLVINTLTIPRKYAPDLLKEFELKEMEKKSCLTHIVNYVMRDDAHDVAEYIDKIPEVGNLIADVGKLLKLEGHSRVYGRWRSKESIGRRTLEKYMSTFRISARDSDNREVVEKMRLLEQALNADVIWDEVISIKYYDGAEDDYVYDFTVPGSESFLVDDGIMVHNTLNSVEWNTEMLIKVDGELVRTKIGEWIDSRIEKADPENIENHPHDTILEYVKDKHILVPACTEEGKIIWDEVEAVTRHPVINKDGTNTLLKITTSNGREVIATKAKSFLKRVNNKIIGVDGDSVKVGDYLPVSCENKEGYDIIPDVVLSDGTKEVRRSELEKYMSECSNELDKKIFESLLEEDIIYDRVVAIEEIVSDHPWVYDLTVKKTRNFNIYNGLCMRDTFHNAGVGAKSIVTTTGVPRIREIINVAKTIKSPSMRIFLKDEFTTNHNKAKMIGNQIEFTKLQDIVDKTMIIYENTNLETNISEDLEFIQTYQEFAQMIGVSTCPPDQLSKWVLRVIFNKEKMMNKNIYLSDIQDYIQRSNSEDEVQCTFSDDNAKEIMMRIRLREDATNANFLQLLQDVEKSLMSIPIRGILGVEKAIPENVKRIVYQPDGSYSQTNEWHLATNGVNLLDVLMNENVDPTRTLSNDINEVAEIFGIEATRSIIIRELMSTPQYDVNYRHISLLGDIMTHRGVIMPIERHGINRSAERGPIAKATFEESTEILVKASTFAEKDKMGGVSANIMFGQLPRVGTNAFDLLFDESKFMMEMKNLRKTEVKNREENKENLVEEIEDKLSKDYPENLGDTIDSQFDFVVDTTKNAEKQLTPHLFPETGLGKAVAKVEPTPEKPKVEEPKKRTIMLKKK